MSWLRSTFSAQLETFRTFYAIDTSLKFQSVYQDYKAGFSSAQTSNSFGMSWSFSFIWNALHDFLPFAQINKRENTHGWVLLLVKLQAEACNFTKSETPPWIFFTFLKLYKWNQIAQRITWSGFEVGFLSSHVSNSRLELSLSYWQYQTRILV